MPPQRRPILSELVDLSHPAQATLQLTQYSDEDYDAATRAYVRELSRRTVVMRGPVLAPRTLASLGRLIRKYADLAAGQEGEPRASTEDVVQQLRAERRAILGLVHPVTTLADLVPLDDADAAVDALLDMTERAFDHAVVTWLAGGRVGGDVMRDVDVVERLYESLSRIVDYPTLLLELGRHPDEARRLGALAEQERKWVRQLAHEARADRAGRGLDSRALQVLGRRHPQELVAIKRALKQTEETASDG